MQTIGRPAAGAARQWVVVVAARHSLPDLRPKQNAG